MASGIALRGTVVALLIGTPLHLPAVPSGAGPFVSSPARDGWTTPAQRAPRVESSEQEEFVPRELLVRFKPGVGGTARSAVLQEEGATREEKLPLPGLQLVRIEPGASLEAAVAAFEDRPEVRYAEPNFIGHVATTPNDPQFGQLWGLHNTGQVVNGMGGTVDADIDALEAWDHTTGSASVQVGVVDTGIAYGHPDLAANMWTNAGETGGGKETNGVDDDANGFIDDWRGWDWANIGGDDNDPFDTEGHGTHVAGTIGARGDNTTGVAGVNWEVQLMALRACGTFGSCTSADVTSAFTYAGSNGADVVNASLGFTSFSQAQSDAIAAASGTLFVVAAGNEASDNDTTPKYPCNYAPANIVCVAATNQNDNLASFSNFGATSVDLAAPGTNVFSTYPYETVMFDDFETPLAGRWTTGGTNNLWERSDTVYASPTHSLSDSPAGPYANNTNSFARTNALDFTSGTMCDAEYQLLNDTATGDVLRFERSTDNATYTGFAHSAGAYTSTIRAGLSGVSGSPTVYLRFRFVSNAAGQDDGAYVDDFHVRCDTPTYEYLNGTSMATPHVAGSAALVWAQDPGATVAEVKDAVLQNVDPLASLSGLVATGGRLNVHEALVAVDTSLPDTSITSGPSGPTNDATPVFGFSATKPHSTFECRIVPDAFAPCTSPHTTAPLSEGSHTFEVQATDEGANTDPTPATQGFTVDTAPPTDPTLSSSSHTPSTWSMDRTVDVSWSGASDAATGVDGFSFLWDTSPTTLPDTVKDAEESATGTTSPSLADGTSHWLHLRTADNAGNWTSTQHLGPFWIDDTAPDTSISGGPSGPTNDTTPTFTFTSTEGSSTFECRVVPDAFAPCTSPHTTAPLTEDSHTFEVQATDPAGNTDGSPAARPFTVDTDPPDTTIVSGPTGTTPDNTPTFTFSSDEGGSTFQCRVVPAAFGPCSGPGASHTTGPLSDGPHTFEVQATDPAGNTDLTPDSQEFTVESPPPPPPAQPRDLTLKAKPKKVEKGDRVTLTGTLSLCTPGSVIEFQKKAGGSFVTFAAVTTGDDCTASVKRKVKKKTTFRAESPSEAGYLGDTSTEVTVKVKRA